LAGCEGALAVVADWAKDTGRETVAQIKKGGGKAEFIKIDVSSNKDILEMIKFAVKTYGRVDVLYNNAGVSARSIEDLSRIIDVLGEDWYRALNINLKNIFLCCKYAIPEMIKAGVGSIINISSLASILEGSGIGPYFRKISPPVPSGIQRLKEAKFR